MELRIPEGGALKHPHWQLEAPPAASHAAEEGGFACARVQLGSSANSPTRPPPGPVGPALLLCSLPLPVVHQFAWSRGSSAAPQDAHCAGEMVGSSAFLMSTLHHLNLFTIPVATSQGISGVCKAGRARSLGNVESK